MIEESDRAWVGLLGVQPEFDTHPARCYGDFRRGKAGQSGGAQHVPLPAAPGDGPATFEQKAVAGMKPLGGAELHRGVSAEGDAPEMPAVRDDEEQLSVAAGGGRSSRRSASNRTRPSSSPAARAASARSVMPAFAGLAASTAKSAMALTHSYGPAEPQARPSSYGSTDMSRSVSRDMPTASQTHFPRTGTHGQIRRR